ncbi:MAG: hypothetical protein ACK4IC_07990 [Erythrobacter sp.]
MALTDVAIRDAKTCKLTFGADMFLPVMHAGGKARQPKYRIGGKQQKFANGANANAGPCDARKRRGGNDAR